MLGTIRIEKYKVHCIIGVHPHERIRDQEVLLDIEILFDASRSIQSDRLHDTIDYERVTELCRELGRSRKYHLIEKFAYDALELLFQEFVIEWGKVRVTKRGAIPLAEAISFEIEKRK